MLGEGIRAGCDFLGWGSRCVCYIERDAYAASCLVARMEDAALDPAPIWDDLDTFDGRSWRGRVDCFAAGFPCQPWSSAGKQAGTEDERWLWPAIARIILDVEPRIVFVENVPGLISGGGLEYVLSDLAQMGFDAEWGHLTAQSVGAAHKRERVFIMAHARSSRRQQISRSAHANESQHEGRAEIETDEPSSRDSNLAHAMQHSGSSKSPEQSSQWADIAGGSGEHLAQSASRRLGKLRESSECDGQPDGSHGALGDAEHDGRREQEPGWRSWRRTTVGGASGVVGDSKRQMCGRQPDASLEGSERRITIDGTSLDMADAQCSGSEDKPWLSASWRESDVANGGGPIQLFAPGPSDVGAWARTIADSPQCAPAVEPGFRVLASGLALVVDESRSDQLRCAGNGVVPAQAAAMFVELARRLGIVDERT